MKKILEVTNTSDVVCNHLLTNQKSTLKLLKSDFFTYPRKYYTICPYCGNMFVFIKNDDGSFVEESEQKEAPDDNV